MGCIKSKPSYIASSAGGERDYQERFLESKTLGQGEFGVVKLVHDVKRKDVIGSKPLAVKYLRKGFVFRDNTLYTPLKKEVLEGEVEILRRLNGECYNLKLVSVYESASMIYIVTEYCEGGEMMPWVSSAFKNSSLRTEDVSRICYQLWSAVDHCAKHRVIHRDIKPENVMFADTSKGSELRLIDFGSGTLNGLTDSPPEEDDRHHTFAGSAFYISPEMFQKTYTSKTDVWSAGASLYVLVAGYPADRLQETFNILQANKVGRLKGLPNMPDNMPDSFYEMLEGALVYRHKQRMDAGELMKGEFSQFHFLHSKDGGNTAQNNKPGTISIHEIAAEAAGEHGDTVPEMANPSGTHGRTVSVSLEGSVSRHNAYLGYQKFERSVTTLLATMLSKDICARFLFLLKEQHQKVEGEKNNPAAAQDLSNGRQSNTEKLQVVTIKVLLFILTKMKMEENVNEREVTEVIQMIEAQNNFKIYENFAYHISLLRQFVSIHTRRTGGDGSSVGGDSIIKSVHGNNVWNSLKQRRGLGGGLDSSGHHRGGDPDSSVRSASSMGGGRGGRGSSRFSAPSASIAF